MRQEGGTSPMVRRCGTSCIETATGRAPCVPWACPCPSRVTGAVRCWEAHCRSLRSHPCHDPCCRPPQLHGRRRRGCCCPRGASRREPKPTRAYHDLHAGMALPNPRRASRGLRNRWKSSHAMHESFGSARNNNNKQQHFFRDYHVTINKRSRRRPCTPAPTGRPAWRALRAQRVATRHCTHGMSILWSAKSART